MRVRQYQLNNKAFLYYNQPAVVDVNLITASGVAPLEFSYEVFKKEQTQ
jgi:hypothetical protein